MYFSRDFYLSWLCWHGWLMGNIPERFTASYDVRLFYIKAFIQVAIHRLCAITFTFLIIRYNPFELNRLGVAPELRGMLNPSSFLVVYWIRWWFRTSALYHSVRRSHPLMKTLLDKSAHPCPKRVSAL